MRVRTILGLAAAVLLLAAACSSSNASPSAAASTSGASLTGGTWKLTGFTEVSPGAANVIPSAEQARYTITFNADMSVAILADCNNVTGTYTAASAPGAMTITLGASTKVACADDSLSDQFLAKLALVASYAYDGSDLILTQSDGGTMSFAT